MLACLAPIVHAQSKDPQKGAALLAEARNALGGDARLAAVKTLDVRGDFKRMAGQATIEGNLQVRIERPDKLRRDEDLSPPGGGPAVVRTEVLNGSVVWDENSGGGGMFFGRFGGRGRGDAGGRGPVDPVQLEEAQRRARQTELARFLLIWLLQTDGPVAWIGTAEAPDGKADVLEMTPANGPALRLYLDVASHLPLMVTWQGVAPQFVAGRRGGRGDAPAPPPPANARQATLRITLGEYKAVDGVKLPHLITRGADEMTLEEWTIDSYRLNSTFRANVFTK